MTSDRFLNAYHNASTAPTADLPADLASFMLAVDPVLADAAELARVLVRAHQGAAAQLIGEGWAHARKYVSLSEKYAAWADYDTPAKGAGIHAYAHTVRKPIRLTDEELRGHPEAELRRRGRQSPTDAGLARRSAHRIRRRELRLHPGIRSARGRFHRSGRSELGETRVADLDRARRAGATPPAGVSTDGWCRVVVG